MLLARKRAAQGGTETQTHDMLLARKRAAQVGLRLKLMTCCLLGKELLRWD